MRYCLTAEVHGNLYIKGNNQYERNRISFEFITDDNNKVNQILVSTKVPDEKVLKFRSTISAGTGKSKFHINIGGDREIYNILLNELQALESNIAFLSNGALKKINWLDIKSEVIPENDEESELLAVSSIKKNVKYNIPSFTLEETKFSDFLQIAPHFNDLLIPKAFWREGLNYFEKFQYIQAFYNYYYVIEDFYAGGKTGMKEVLKNF